MHFLTINSCEDTGKKRIGYFRHAIGFRKNTFLHKWSDTSMIESQLAGAIRATCACFIGTGRTPIIAAGT